MCCCFQVTAPKVASLNLDFAADDFIQSAGGATLNGEPFEPNPNPRPAFQKLEGKIKLPTASAVFISGHNTLVVKVLNNTGPYGFYAEGTAITGILNAVSSRPRARSESPPARDVAPTHIILYRTAVLSAYVQ